MNEKIMELEKENKRLKELAEEYANVIRAIADWEYEGMENGGYLVEMLDECGCDSEMLEELGLGWINDFEEEE